ncbi:MAG TPA: response regulator [Nitrososphaeraceae archaeon]|nr:response regulator [Nitrososphaeraceae archaeon]
MKSRDNLINWLVSLKNLEAGITDSVIKRIVGVIDDDIDITTLFHDALCENVLEASVYAFNDPISAIEHFTENKENYALVISDLRMTGLNGLELLKKVKAANPKVRTILMSAYNFDEDPTYQQYMKEGIIDASIEKPVTIHRLCQRVKEELQSYQIALSK